MAAPPKWPAHRVREKFLSYFEYMEHERWPSSTVIAAEDSPLLFADAGMKQVMPVFLGTAAQGSQPGGPLRACNSVKCIRSAVKDSYLTFTEVLGNWSLGDYFKEEAIAFAWELLTGVYKLPKDRIYTTYFGGDETSGLVHDLESKHIWLKYLPPGNVVPSVHKANFCKNGDTGPCGPCSQIHFDCIGHHDAAFLVNNDDPTCIEIWNIVFFEFNKEADGRLIPLASKNVGSGLHIEQLTSILQFKRSKYATDIFMPTIDAIHQFTGNEIQSYSGTFGRDDIDDVDLAHRIIADHIRTIAFAIADGSQPGIEIPRNMRRRAIHFGHQKLKAKQGFLTLLVDTFIKSMSGEFPELSHNAKKIKDIIEEEETSFAKDKKKSKRRIEMIWQDNEEKRRKEEEKRRKVPVLPEPVKAMFFSLGMRLRCFRTQRN